MEVADEMTLLASKSAPPTVGARAPDPTAKGADHREEDRHEEAHDRKTNER
jgi:hypothetical protein